MSRSIRPLSSRARTALAVPLIASLTLAGLAACSTDNNQSATAASASETNTSTQGKTDAGQWPRTVSVGKATVEVAAQPTRIVALSTELADLALELVGPQRVVAVTKNALDETSGNQIELAKKVENTVANATKPDPEQILSFKPDLVLLTGRHDREQSAGDLLEGSGVPTAQFGSSDFASPQAVAESVTTLGKLLGAEEKAAEMVERINSETKKVTDAVDPSAPKPRTMVLFARGGQKMIMGAQSATTNLVDLAGGEAVSPKGGRPGAVAADPEAIIKANPEVILVQDFHGAGMGQFEELLHNPALAEVPAIKNGRVKLIDAKSTSGTAGMELPKGLKEVADALAK